MTEIISHPGKPLIVHLREVARNCASIISERTFDLGIDQEVLRKLAFIQGAVHDIGKATRNFQEYIHSNGEKVSPPKHHALISAYLGKLLAEQYLKESKLSKFDQEILSKFIFTAIKRHHGNVKNFDEEMETLSEKEADLLILRDNFFEQEVQAILDELVAEVGLQYSWQDFKTYLADLEQVFIEFTDFSVDTLLETFETLSNSQKASYFYLHHLFYATLLLSDKTDVKLGNNKVSRRTDFPYQAIETFRETKGFNQPTSVINQLKNQAYYEGIAQLKHAFDPQQHLYSITLPTGLGKTITSLAIAMELRKRLDKQQARIIVTIPFTSIIDQNYTVFQEVFQYPSSDLLLKHHHMAEPRYKMQEDSLWEGDLEASKFLIETWQSEVVVTTFVQLLEGIFTNNKAKLLKYPNLMNAIIVLDEIQQINYELWELVRTAFQVLAKRYQCYFILMSATQPLIFEPEKEIQEVIPHYRQYFQYFNRTRLINRTEEEITLADFTRAVITYHERYPKKDILVILNTKETARQCFHQVIEQVSRTAAQVYFLSTWITPYERKAIIRRIKAGADLPAIIISTQLIEAGVDISVDTVFRAFAPLDAIIQAAGRANRYAEKADIASVYLYHIKELEKATNLLYGKSLMTKTQNVLRGKKTINESHYLALIQAYYQEVRKDSDNYQSKELAYLCQLKFADLGKFNLIDYRKTESLFVQLDAKAKDVWTQYEAIYRDPKRSIFEKREAFALIKSIFYDYVINIPVPYDQEHINFDSEAELHFYVSRLDRPSRFYSYDPTDFRSNTGYQPSTTITL